METAYIQLIKPDFPSNADFFPSADIRQSVAEHRSPISNRKDTNIIYNSQKKKQQPIFQNIFSISVYRTFVRLLTTGWWVTFGEIVGRRQGRHYRLHTHLPQLSL